MLAARLALVGSDEGWVGPFTRAVYTAAFAEGADISERTVLQSIVDGLRLDSERIFSQTEQTTLKDRLKQQTAEAQARGIFGAPTFLADDEMFWGDDRLEQALAWAKRG